MIHIHSQPRTDGLHLLTKPLMILILSTLLVNTHQSFGQSQMMKLEDGTPIVWVNHWVSTHFISSNLIQYIDLSTEHVLGDIPHENIARIRPIKAFHSKEQDMGYVTIVGNGFFQQFRLRYTVNPDLATKNVRLNESIDQAFGQSPVSLSKSEALELAKKVWHNKPTFYAVGSKKDLLEIRLNNLYVFGGYLFVDFQIENKTEVPIKIQQIDYSIDDKTIAKASNQQSIKIQPYLKLLNNTFFNKYYRNVVVFHQFTLLDSKVFTIRVLEEGITGRTITLIINNRDILSADVP